MATDTFTNTFESQTDAQFRSWGSRVAQAFATCGLVKTADTSQIDWTTVTRTGTTTGNTDQVAGYEMYRFNDALQATKPVFIKIEYGFHVEYSGVGRVSSPGIYMTVGTATNGAGTLTGAMVTQRFRFTGSGNAINVSGPNFQSVIPSPSPCHAAGDGSYINMALGAQAVSQPIWVTTDNTGFVGRRSFPSFMSVERTRNADGSANGNGVAVCTANWYPNTNTEPTAPTTAYQMISYSLGVVTASIGEWPIAWDGPGFGTANVAGDIYYIPFLGLSPTPGAPLLCWLGTWKNDVPLLSVQTISIGGVNRSYLSLAGIAGVNASDNARSYVNGSVPLGALMMRYE